MDEQMKNLSDQELDEASGGAGPAVQRTNFCRRCRGAAYKLIRVERDGTQIRECKTCHLEYKYRAY